MIDAYYAKTMNLPMTIYTRTSLRTFYDTTKKHLRCLQSLGEDDNQMQTFNVKSKSFHAVLYTLFYKQHFYKQSEAEIGKKIKEMLSNTMRLNFSYLTIIYIFYPRYNHAKKEIFYKKYFIRNILTLWIPRRLYIDSQRKN